MGRAWRIVKARHAATAFDGEGARIYGGRWNSPGTRLIYASGSQALAALEILVHLHSPVALSFVAVPVEFDDALVEKIALPDLPRGWTGEPPPPITQRIGDRWVRQARSAVLELPSVIIRSESNFLLNPAHPDFPSIRIGSPVPFAFDPRLL